MSIFKRQPEDEIERLLRVAELVQDLDETSAMSPKQIARKLGHYETSTKVDLSYLEQQRFVKTRLPHRRVTESAHAPLYYGAEA